MFRIKVLWIVCSLMLGAAGLAYCQTCLFSEPPSSDCLYPRVIPGNVGQHVVLMDVHAASTTRTLVAADQRDALAIRHDGGEGVDPCQSVGEVERRPPFAAVEVGEVVLPRALGPDPVAPRLAQADRVS